MIYIALLRGVNVGSKNTLKMKDLVEAFEKQKFKDVRSYIQSGNIIFGFKNIATKKLEENIESLINSNFGITVNAIIRTEYELEMIIKQNPFIKVTGLDIEKLHVTFLSDEVNKKLIPALDVLKDKNERFSVHDKEVFLYCPNGYGRTKLNNTNLEKKLKTTGTTRNWNTTKKLLEIAKSKYTR